MRSINLQTGQSTFIMVGIIFLITIIMIGVYFTVSQVNITTSGSHKAQQIAIEATDAAVNQMISDIVNRQINVFGTTLPITENYPVTVSSTTLIVPVTLDLLRDAMHQPVLDLEGNNRYVLDAIASPIMAYGAKGTTSITRHVQANVSIVNLARYNAFTISNDMWASSGGTFDGPYHCNSYLEIGGTMYWNSSTLSGGGANPFWSDTYVTMAANDIRQLGGWSAPTFRTQVAKFGRLTTYAGFDICTTTSRLLGTWFDRQRGGMVVTIRPIPYSAYYNYSQVILQKSLLPWFRLNGTDVSCGVSSNLIIDVGVTGITNAHIKVNLNAFGTGSTDDVFQGATNYNNALASTYGIVIYSIDDVAVYGRLPTAVNNTNKKIMIVSQKSIELIGDIMYSGDIYTTGSATYNPSLPVPVPATSNPTNDAIALICTDNIYVNPWRKVNTSFFKNSNDMKISGFLYGYSGCLCGGGRSYKSGGSSSITQFTTFGGQTFNTGGYVPGNFNVGYDALLNLNISRLVPVGVGVISWMEIK
ncbi:MAG: hypothetical protein ABH873_10580 [Candidatus Firestonebacteria bacterium]